MFKPYTHIEKFGNTEVEGIELGKVYVFPKLDGTNSSLWMEGRENEWVFLKAGARTRQLDTINPGNQDNAGFASWCMSERIFPLWNTFFKSFPNLRLYGEWLVPHSFKGYREDAWNKFYVFDVYNDETNQYLSYEQYASILNDYGIEYIPPLALITNASYENFLKILNQNFFLCPDGGVPGKGIVIKNYDYQNKFGQQCFAKIIRQEFKELHARTMGAPEINTGIMNEERVLDICLTQVLIDKTIAKISNEHAGWSSKNIPELFGRVYYDIIKEELFDALKEINFGTINFKTLKAIMINRIKQMIPEIF